jgi:hypothetical protein
MPNVFTGTLEIPSLIKARFLSPVQVGLDKLAQDVNNELSIWNARSVDLISTFAEITEDRKRRSGSALDGSPMDEVDEFGVAPAKKVLPGMEVEFPLKKYNYNLGWTDDWFAQHTVEDMFVQVVSARTSYSKTIQREIKKAVFLKSNYTVSDTLRDGASLAVKRFVNADGASLPIGPNGEIFDGSTETHYLGTASFVTGDLTSMVDQLVEKGHGGNVRIYINRAQETAVRGFADFTAYSDPRIQYVATDFTTKRVDITRQDNRAIGIHGSAEVWVKPWIPAGYVFAYDADSPKPLAMRRHKVFAPGLRVNARLSAFPLNADYMTAYMGFGVYNRTNGVCLDTGNASYTDPTITS